MHEMSLVTSLLSIIREEMERHALHRLLQVRARYGALANVVPEAVRRVRGSYGRNGLGRAVLQPKKSPLAQMFSMRTNLFSRSAETFFGTVPFLWRRTRALHRSGTGTLYPEHGSGIKELFMEIPVIRNVLEANEKLSDV